MTNDPSKSDFGVELVDPELEQLLGDAYDAPPVPRSLLKKIDRTIKSEWGESPRVSESRTNKVRSELTKRTRWLRAVPVAACLGIIIAFALVFSSGSTTYAWSKVVEAMAKQGLIEVDTVDGSRWVSLSERVVGEANSDSLVVADANQKAVFYHRYGSEKILKQKMASDDFNENKLLVHFFAGDMASDSRYSNLKLSSEKWEQVNEDIALDVNFDTDDGEAVNLHLVLDAETHLPQRYRITTSNKDLDTSNPLSYSEGLLADNESRQLPGNLTITTVDDIAIASLSTPDKAEQIDLADLVNDSQSMQGSDSEASESIALATKDGSSGIGFDDWASQAPSTWQAVIKDNSPGSKTVDKVNDLITELWEEKNITPVAPAEDVELLRRVYLDLAGRTPSVNEVRAYLKDDSGQRYENLVDRLLKSPDHASHLAAVWRTFLIPEGVDLDAFGGITAFDKWLAKRFESGDGYDQIVDDLLLAEGRLSRSGPLLFYSAVKLNPDELAARTARVFLGMRLECAQCHDHPFEPWKQEDFWGFAAFFAQISRPNAELETVSTVMRVSDVDHGEVKIPLFDTVVAPKHLNTDLPLEQSKLARREQLVEWLTSADNPYFARATANRVWGHLFGKGIVDPIDDFGTRNLPKSSELLDLIASRFVSTDFNLRELFRLIVLSKPYRLSSGSEDVDEQRLEWFAQMNVKTLTAEQVYDCISVATLLESSNMENPYAFNVSRFGNGERETFLKQFRTPAGRSTEYQGGIPQALTLMNGTLIDGATGLARSGLLASLDAPFFTNKQRIEVLYLATLSRNPSSTEWTMLQEYIPQDATGDELHQGLSDVLWALLNSAEFTMNH